MIQASVEERLYGVSYTSNTGFQWNGLTSKHIGWLRGMLILVLILSLFDALMTVLWVDRGLATESNPMMDVLLMYHPVLFVLVKTVLVGLCSFSLWRLATKYRSVCAVVSIMVACVVYLGVLLIHLHGIHSGFLELALL